MAASARRSLSRCRQLPCAVARACHGDLLSRPDTTCVACKRCPDTPTKTVAASALQPHKLGMHLTCMHANQYLQLNCISWRSLHCTHSDVIYRLIWLSRGRPSCLISEMPSKIDNDGATGWYADGIHRYNAKTWGMSEKLKVWPHQGVGTNASPSRTQSELEPAVNCL